MVLDWAGPGEKHQVKRGRTFRVNAEIGYRDVKVEHARNRHGSQIGYRSGVGVGELDR